MTLKAVNTATLNRAPLRYRAAEDVSCLGSSEITADDSGHLLIKSRYNSGFSWTSRDFGLTGDGYLTLVSLYLTYFCLLGIIFDFAQPGASVWTLPGIAIGGSADTLAGLAWYTRDPFRLSSVGRAADC